jgi:predicted metal-dependent enzyme (double-stranded beta helix superfamily)
MEDGGLLGTLIERLTLRAPLERSISEMAELLAATRARASLGRPLPKSPGGYTRTCVHRDERFEVLLLNWDAGAVSAVHDHGGQHCWMMVLEGQLRVDDYVRLDRGDVPGVARVAPRGSRVMPPGGLDLRSRPFDLHRVSAGSNASTVSLHVYAGPLTDFLIYDEKAQRCERVRGTYDEVLPPYAFAAQ